MKISIAGLVRLKPFDEASDKVHHGTLPLLALGVWTSFLVAASGLVLAVFERPIAKDTMIMAIAISTVTAGVEWHSGLRARALNQLFVMALCALGIVLIS